MDREEIVLTSKIWTREGGIPEPERPDPPEVVEVIHQMHSSGRGVIGMKLVGDGKLRDESEKIDQALRFVLGLGSVDMMIVGFESEAQIDNYLDRMELALKELV